MVALVVDEGQPACAAGMLIRLHDQPRIVADGGMIMTSNRADVAATRTVPLRCVTTDIDLDAHTGKQVVATGTLRDGHLVINTADGLAPRLTFDSAAAARRHDGSTVVGGIDRLRITRQLPVETALLNQGMLLDIWIDDRTGRRIALATDPDRVRAALTKYHGDALDVVQSRWSQELLDQILAAVDEDLLVSHGTNISQDQQMQVAMTLLHLPTWTAHRLGQFPVDSMAVSVLISPHPSLC